VCTRSGGCNGVPFGKPIVSNKWLFTMTGGGSCYVDDSTTPGVYDDPSTCVQDYMSGELHEMGTAANPPMKTLFGIHSPSPTKNPVFASYNRVRIEKSSFDRYQGQATFQAPGGMFTMNVPGAGNINFNLYHHGYKFIAETIRLLEYGLKYRTWINSGGAVKAVTETLPSLVDATNVLFIGHSGAAHGLYHNIDRLKDLLPYSDVSALFDANFEPGVLNEAAFADDQNTGLPLGGDAYTNQWVGESSAQGSTFTYDGEDFHTNRLLAEQHESWQAPLDASCLSTHSANQWACNDRMHVLMNHIETPIMVRQDWRDPNTEHLNGANGYTVQWGDMGVYPWCSGGPCLPVMSIAERDTRLAEQATTFIWDANARSEIGTNVDPSLGGSFPTQFVWMPQCQAHNGAYDDKQFFGVGIKTGSSVVTLRQYAERFMAASPLNGRNYRVVGFSTPAGTPMTQVTCP
jgi:hypothetical protein